MTDVQSNNKRIAQNTLYLYIRTFMVMCVQLYTSRLILQILGETDLGIYNIVGGIVTMMSFVNVAQTKSTSRFITYSLGKGESKEQTNVVFSQCMTIHVIICILVLFIGETLGLYIVNYWISMPNERVFAANIVYQLSLMTFVLHFFRVPYDSIIVAHEKMQVYAYMSILEVFLQLLLVFAIIYLGGDNLIIYAVSVCTIALILLVFIKLYINKTFKSYFYKWNWSNTESLKILSFSGWTLLGSTASTATQQGVSLLFNNFVGLVANTALGFANQVNVAVARFVSSFSTAFNPQIIKYYAEGNRTAMHALMNRASKFSFALCYVMALPLIVNMEFVLTLWLGNIPQYTVEFCQLIIICSIVDSVSCVFNTSITATGNLKFYEFFISVSFLMDLLFAFVLLNLGFHPAVVFGSRILTRGVLNMFIGILFSKKLLEFKISKYLNEVLIPVLVTIAFTIPIAYYTRITDNSFWGLITSTSCSIFAVTICMLTFLLDKEEKTTVLSVIKRVTKTFEVNEK